MNLWPVEHFFPRFFPDQHWISTDLEKNGGKKCSTGQMFIFFGSISDEIHILACVGAARKVSTTGQLRREHMTQLWAVPWIV